MSLALILERAPELVVAAQAGSLTEARGVLPEIAGTVDVALVDLNLPEQTTVPKDASVVRLDAVYRTEQPGRGPQRRITT
jgi:hypothetical protein